MHLPLLWDESLLPTMSMFRCRSTLVPCQIRAASSSTVASMLAAAMARTCSCAGAPKAATRPKLP